LGAARSIFWHSSKESRHRTIQDGQARGQAPGRALREKARDVPKCILEATGLSLADLQRPRHEIAALRQSLLNSRRLKMPSQASA
jgi:hypothetical protein